MKKQKKTERRLVLTTLTLRTLAGATGGGRVGGLVVRPCHEPDSLMDPWSQDKIVTK